MGRASKRNAIPDPAIDQGDPGTFYWPFPKLEEIEGKKKTTTVTTFTKETNWNELPARSKVNIDGNCRLVSSHEIRNYTPPTGLEYALPRWSSKLDGDAYVEMFKVQGYGVGAVVTRRHQPLEHMDKVYHWGVITFVTRHMSTTPWQPYFVKWFGDGAGEHAWAEDLVIIHAALDRDVLGSVFEAQDITLPEEKKS